ncbi:enolase C-terminal domain-like protein [Trichoderma citrinoviride]|uniref:Enolase C-terminal domain-like protein n=1 Tax=Trichoderma citrinoviride TaxID=58853 RepID=A0A2T4AZZ2_9HYPO|nr:enolase C-terminal domain-like protein [Trichoderma citrinoviride]PTB62636.1 enolase C-terminal domain-like protein [Trichoderma citrinoviride]
MLLSNTETSSNGASPSLQIPASEVVITGFTAHDLRFPTSLDLSGSDAMNPGPNYSAAYIVLHTNSPSPALSGHGFAFTIGRGNNLCVLAAEMIAERLVGKTLEQLTSNMGQTWRHLVSDSQLRWVGPEKGVIHLGLSTCVNAVWDLWARYLGKPVWQVVSDMTPEEFVRCIDFRYILDAITPEEAVALLREQAKTKAARLEEARRSKAVPAYTTQAGWLGFSDEKMVQLIQSNLAQGMDKFKFKVGGNLEDDMRRLQIARDTIGYDRLLMVDANQVWSVPEAIDYMLHLVKYKPLFIEEPTSPDDILGHAAIRKALKPYGVGVATGEHCQNRVMFKQLLQAGSIDYCQIDACRLGGVNEVMAVLLMAKKFNVPIVPHSGGIGLNEYTQHLALINYLCVSGEKSLLEHISSFREVLKTPCQTKDGHFVTPRDAGYSVEYKPEAIEKYTYPTGSFWTSEQGLAIINEPKI